MVNVRVSRNGDGVEEGAKAKAGGGIPVDGHYVFAPAMTYIMSRPYVEKFVPPDPAYLTSVYHTLNGSIPELSGRPIEVCDYTGERKHDPRPFSTDLAVYLYPPPPTLIRQFY